MHKDHNTPSGELHTIRIDSDALKSNMLGDPALRDVVVYVPHGHDGKGLPLLVDVVGYTGSGLSHAAWKNFGENLPERLDRLIAAGELPPVVVAFPDCFTRLGGNQYINSVVMGRWEDFLIDEMLPAVESKFGCGRTGKRGLFGKSSGGYGAIIHALLRSDTWSAAACHSGDMAFELCYLPDVPSAVRAIAKAGSFEKWMTDFEAGPKWDNSDIHDLMTFAMAATYDPDPKAYLGVRLPVDMETCEVDQALWANWLKWDPVLLVDDHIEDLKSLKGLWIDCGDVDQYNLVYGARRMHKKLEAAGVDHVYEEFSDNHSAIDYRMDKSLPFLAKALMG